MFKLLQLNFLLAMTIAYYTTAIRSKDERCQCLLTNKLPSFQASKHMLPSGQL